MASKTTTKNTTDATDATVTGETAAIIATAVAAQFTRVEREGEFRRVSVSRTEAFVASAKATFAARQVAQDIDIAAAVEREAYDRGLVTKGANGKAKATGEDGEALYMSSTAVAFHGRTGQFLSLDGDMPEDVTPEDVQALVKRVTNRKVKGADEIETNDEILSSATTKVEAYDRLVQSEMLKALHAEQVAAAKAATTDPAGDPEPKVAKDLLGYISAMQGPVDKVHSKVQVTESFDTFVTADGIAALDALVGRLMQAQTYITAALSEREAISGAKSALADKSA